MKKAISIGYLLEQKYLFFKKNRYCVRHCMENTEVVYSDEIFISLLNKACGIMF